MDHNPPTLPENGDRGPIAVEIPVKMSKRGKGVKAKLFLAVRKSLNQPTRRALKQMSMSWRRRLGSVYVVTYGRTTARDLVGQLESRIPKDVEILMVHSSYDRLLPMYSGTPKDLINELINCCGTTRTLVMPAFVLGGRGYDKKEYFSKRAFDVARTPSEMGLLTEIFRRTPGVLRSLHPTHSICALGPLAQDLTATHHLASTRTGKWTPFEVMTHKRTAIVGLGVEYYRSLAHTHTAEDTLGDQFPITFHRESIAVNLIDRGGNRLKYALPIPQASEMVDNTLLRELLTEKELVEWRFRGTAMYLTFASLVTERLIEAAKNGITVYR
jgi:aminoglycoside N3'-acetyltransferase